MDRQVRALGEVLAQQVVRVLIGAALPWKQLPWVAAQEISTHWLRHATLTWVERHYGYGIARAYAGHTNSVGPATTTYIKADLHAVATALAAMTGQPHPLAHPKPTARNRPRRRHTAACLGATTDSQV